MNLKYAEWLPFYTNSMSKTQYSEASLRKQVKERQKIIDLLKWNYHDLDVQKQAEKRQLKENLKNFKVDVIQGIKEFKISPKPIISSMQAKSTQIEEYKQHLTELQEKLSNLEIEKRNKKLKNNKEKEDTKHLHSQLNNYSNTVTENINILKNRLKQVGVKKRWWSNKYYGDKLHLNAQYALATLNKLVQTKKALKTQHKNFINGKEVNLNIEEELLKDMKPLSEEVFKKHNQKINNIAQNLTKNSQQSMKSKNNWRSKIKNIFKGKSR